jgi:hypothetical protein
MTTALTVSTSTQNRPGYLPGIPPLTPPASPNIPANAPQVPSMLVYVKDKAKWEYKVLTRNLAKEQPPTEEELNALGNDSWALAGVANDSPFVYFYFKRPMK